MDHYQEFKSVFQKLNPAAKIDEGAEEFLKEIYQDLQTKADSLVPENEDEITKFSELYKHELFYFEGKRYMKTGPEKAVTWNPGPATSGSEEGAQAGRRKMDQKPKTFQKEKPVQIQKDP